MKIRSEQMQALSAAQRATYIRRTSRELCREFPRTFSEADECEVFLSGAIDEAAAYGVRKESDLTFYLRL